MGCQWLAVLHSCDERRFSTWNMVEHPPFLWAFSSTAIRSFSLPWIGSIRFRSRVLGWSACTVWRGPRTKPFTFSWLTLSSFFSIPARAEEERECWHVKKVTRVDTRREDGNNSALLSGDHVSTKRSFMGEQVTCGVVLGLLPKIGRASLQQRNKSLWKEDPRVEIKVLSRAKAVK